MKNLQEGLKPYTEDTRDFNLGALIKWPQLSELPNEFWTIPFSIKDQLKDGNDDFCASCAGTGMIEPEEEVELFYPFLFAAAKFESGEDPDMFGLQLRDVGKALTKWGVPEVKDVPKEVLNFNPSQRRRFENYQKFPNLMASAKKHQQQTYFFIKDYPYDAFDSARAIKWYFRDKKQHFMFGTRFGWPLNTFLLEGFPDGLGHAMWNNGWFKTGVGAVNSAGKDTGKDGMHAVSRETFNRYANEFGMMMVVDMPRDDAEYLLKHQILLDDVNILTKVVKLLRDFISYLNASKIIKGFAEVVAGIFSKRN